MTRLVVSYSIFADDVANDVADVSRNRQQGNVQNDSVPNFVAKVFERRSIGFITRSEPEPCVSLSLHVPWTNVEQHARRRGFRERRSCQDQ